MKKTFNRVSLKGFSDVDLDVLEELNEKETEDIIDIADIAMGNLLDALR